MALHFKVKHFQDGIHGPAPAFYRNRSNFFEGVLEFSLFGCIVKLLYSMLTKNKLGD